MKLQLAEPGNKRTKSSLTTSQIFAILIWGLPIFGSIIYMLFSFFKGICLLGFFGIMAYLTANYKTVLPKLFPTVFKQQETNIKIKDNITENVNDYLKHSIFIGTSTGILSERWHTQGLAGNQKIYIPFRSCCQNFIVFGQVGEGKTKYFINSVFDQLVKADNYSIGGLVFDIKGNDFINDVKFIARKNNREIQYIGVKEGQLKINLIAGLSPSLATDFLKSAYILGAGAKDDNDVWMKNALGFTRNVLKILEYTGDYTLKGLYQFIALQNKRDELIGEANLNHGALIAPDIDYINAVNYITNFYNYDQKLRDSVMFTLTPILEPFQSAELQNTFSNVDSPDNYDMKNILNNGDIVLLDLPLAQYTEAGKIIYTMIKMRFYNLVETRNDEALKLNKDRYVFMVCDEFQDIIQISDTGLSDSSFFAKSRSRNCIGVVSSQSYEALKTAVGNESRLNTFLANFVQKFCFKSSDPLTCQLFQKMLGKVEVEKKTRNEAVSKGIIWANKETSGHSYSMIEKNVIDEQLFRELGVIPGKKTRTALAFLTIDGISADDVIQLEPLFTD